ncbi:MAG: FtsQ-type protein [Paucimonas sp.]|jgi:cell division protein FtsQ|nr:FtsQ-type protein [Paucimonas sp.]
MWHDVKMLNAATSALLGMFVLMLLSAGIWWITQRPIFALHVIRVEGIGQEELRHVNVSTMRSSALPRIKGNFFTVNLDSVRVAFESVPWVNRAAVRREWPDKLVVNVEEHVPLGTWGDEGRLVSVKGDLFTANLAEAEEDAELAEFDGPDGSEKDVISRYAEFREWFAPTSLAPEGVQLSARYAWTVRLNNGMTVELGREQDREALKARVDRLVAVYPQLVARLQDRIENIDLRYPNGMALRAQGLAFGLEKGKQKAGGTT